jgi:hypothetical protein
MLQDVFGKGKNPSRLVYGVASLPLGTRSNSNRSLRSPDAFLDARRIVRKRILKLW